MLSKSCNIYSPMHDNGNNQGLNKVHQLIPAQAESDEQLLKLWLHGRSKHTQRAYIKDVSGFLEFVQKEICLITLGDLQDYSEQLFGKDLCQGSIRRALASIKSMFGFAHRIGYIQFDIGRPLRVPTPKNALAQRILSEEEIQTIISSIENSRNKLMVKTLYYTGLRISELVSLKWSDVQPRDMAGQITVQGKGSKTNNILIPEHLFDDLVILRGLSSDQSAVFKSRNGGHLNSDHVRKMLKEIAIKAIGKGATPHWYRHSHASHALDNGCPIHLVQKQLNHSSIATTGRYLHARPTESSSKYLK
ncbi:MAG: tyrosine-type recombinase/integrase [Phycisphaerae bacterium]|nr:tyrosine-type recombinase/integrase [Phycisphaerae bacterium]